jgi:hypothetical protein
MGESTDTVAPLLTLTAAGAGTFNGPSSINPWGRGVTLGINTTVDTAGSYVVNIQGLDVASGQFYTICTSAAIAAAGFSTLTVYPGITASASAFSAPLPRTWRVQSVVTTGPITATIGASVMQ